MDVRFPFRVGQNIDFAVRLLEGLRDAKMRKLSPPCQHVTRIGLHRMPESDANARCVEIQRCPGFIQHAVRRRQPRDQVLAELE